MSKKSMLYAVAALIVILLIGIPTLVVRRNQKQVEGTRLKTGARAPDFTLLDHRRRPVKLSEILAANKNVVLAFYIKASTPG